jgi:sodium transport system ATP-binding protein
MGGKQPWFWCYNGLIAVKHLARNQEKERWGQSMSIVETERLTRQFGALTAVNAVNIAIDAGEIFGLLGPNGAGKTTTLRIISTLLSPDAGTVDVLGFGTRTAPEEVRRRIGVVTADIGVYPRLSARENIEYFARLCGLSGAELVRKVDGVVERLDMGSFAKQRAESLSSGQKQKVAIARAIVHDPDVLMFDEPTSNLDVLASKEVREFMVEVKGRGKCVIFSTHVMHDAERLCDRITIIHHGRVVASGPTDEVRGQRRDLEDAFLALVEAS